MPYIFPCTIIIICSTDSKVDRRKKEDRKKTAEESDKQRYEKG